MTFSEKSRDYRKWIIGIILAILILFLMVAGFKIIVDQINPDPLVEYYNQPMKLSQIRSQQSEYHCTQKAGMNQNALESVRSLIAQQPTTICFNTTQEVDTYLEEIGIISKDN